MVTATPEERLAALEEYVDELEAAVAVLEGQPDCDNACCALTDEEYENYIDEINADADGAVDGQTYTDLAVRTAILSLTRLAAGEDFPAEALDASRAILTYLLA